VATDYDDFSENKKIKIFLFCVRFWSG